MITKMVKYKGFYLMSNYEKVGQSVYFVLLFYDNLTKKCKNTML